MPDQSDRPASSPDGLVLRAAFVPDGELPPWEFTADMNPLHMRATYDPRTGEITCDNAGYDFCGEIRAQWQPDEDQDQSDDGGSQTGSGNSGGSRAGDDKGQSATRGTGWKLRPYPGDRGGGPDTLDTNPGNAIDQSASPGAAGRPGAVAWGSALPLRGNPASTAQASSGPAVDGPATPASASSPSQPQISENAQTITTNANNRRKG